MFEHKSETVVDPPALYEPSVPLKTMSGKALELLSRDRDGFFLLIEEEGIDEMAHHANTPLMIKAGEALDDTVAMALGFAARTPGTLVLVVGDHETGGLAIENVEDIDENAPGEQAEDTYPIANSDLEMTVDWTTNGHTGAATPITSSGPGAERLGKVLKNTMCMTRCNEQWACRAADQEAAARPIDVPRLQPVRTNATDRAGGHACSRKASTTIEPLRLIEKQCVTAVFEEDRLRAGDGVADPRGPLPVVYRSACTFLSRNRPLNDQP